MRHKYLKSAKIIILLVTLLTLLTACSSSTSNPDLETAQLIVTVINQNNTKLENVTVELDSNTSKQTDANGVVKFDDVENREHTLSLNKSGYQERTGVEVVVDSDPTTKEVQLTQSNSGSDLTIIERENYIDLTDTKVKFLFKTETTNQVNFYLGTTKDDLEKVKDGISYNNQGIIVSNLTPGEKYYYQIEVVSGDSKTTSPILSFDKLANTNDWQPAKWAEETVFYEVFVRSFYDGNGDDIGDFVGLKEKIPYFEKLGVDALWLMPINKSPSYHGYDVVDYYETDPDYGTKQEFREFLQAAHQAGIKVIMDLVVNHSSTQHQWFEEAAQGENNEYRDYYIWEDKFTNVYEEGPWGQDVWHNSSSGHYYGVFWSGMPDLNQRNPKVRTKMKEIAEYWLDPNGDGDFSDGVDGFRLDAALHIDDKDPQVTHNFWQEFNTAVKAVNPQAFLVGENWTKTADMAKFYEDLDSSFNFDFAAELISTAQGNQNDFLGTLQNIHDQYRQYSSQYIDSTFLSNHDQNRVASELNGSKPKIKLAASLLLTSPGTPFIYYGEELGQEGQKPDPNIREPFDWYQDAQGPGMTTMSKGGFGQDMDYTYADDGISLAEQEGVPGSIFEHYQRLIEIRNNHPALFHGENYQKLDAPTGMYAYQVQSATNDLYVVHNLSETKREITVDSTVQELVTTTDYASGDKITLSTYETVILKTSADLTIDFPTIEQYSVTFVVDVPSDTSSDAEVYCSSQLNNWQAVDSDYQLSQRSDGDYEITIQQLPGTSMQFKFTLGPTGDYEMIDDSKATQDGFISDGSGNINRLYEFNADNQVLNLTVSAWQ